MPYYDRIARQWHQATGYAGGAFRQFVLNDLLLKKMERVEGSSILELGAGNGYFLRWALRHFSGQLPTQIVITDQSGTLLEIARTHFRIPQAEYRLLDVRQQFPFADNSFDLIVASMVFNELLSKDFGRALKECHRVLSSGGVCLSTVTHPDFIDGLRKRHLLRRTKEGIMTMPASGSLRLPVVLRSAQTYRNLLKEAQFQFEEENVFPTTEVLKAKSGLRSAGKAPLALVFRCKKVV